MHQLWSVRPYQPQACCCQWDSSSCECRNITIDYFGLWALISLWLWLGRSGDIVIMIMMCMKKFLFLFSFPKKQRVVHLPILLISSISYLGFSDTRVFLYLCWWVVVVLACKTLKVSLTSNTYRGKIQYINADVLRILNLINHLWRND